MFLTKFLLQQPTVCGSLSHVVVEVLDGRGVDNLELASTYRAQFIFEDDERPGGAIKEWQAARRDSLKEAPSDVFSPEGRRNQEWRAQG